MMEHDLCDEAVGWAVFNRGEVDARIERIEDTMLLPDDEAAIRHCIAHAGDDPRCLLALCETFATDGAVACLVENNLLVTP